MTRSKFAALCSAALLGLLGAAGCAQDASREAGSLDELVVTDPDFTFATSRSVRLELRAPDGEPGAAVEVSDAEGRRLMDGAFVGSAQIDLKIPVGAERRLNVRTVRGDAASLEEVSIDPDGRAVVER